MNIPKNVKQIGTIDDSICIYLEDYVYTYLYQYAKKDLSGEKVAFLVGKINEEVSDKALLISGAIEAKYTKEEDGKLIFTHQTWSYVEAMLQNYFEGYEVIGWMCSQPGYGLFMTSHHVEIHNKYFCNENQLLFLMDPVEKNEQFYIWKNNRLKEMKGYFIYYQRNEDMHHYMIDDKSGRLGRRKSFMVNDAIEDVHEVNEGQDIKGEKGEEKNIISYRDRRNRENKEDSKSYVNMLTSLSAVLLAVCVIMGLGLLNNSSKVSSLEKNMKSLYGQMSMLENKFGQDTKAVMAVQDPEPINSENNEAVIINENSNVTVEENNNAKVETVDETVEKAVENLEEVTKEATTEEVEKVVAEPEQYTEYIVKSGDSLVKISWRFFNSNIMVDKIMEINNIDNANKIYEGKVLKIPKS